MKILAFTDTHGSEEAMDIIEQRTKDENVDLLVCCGDLTVFEHDFEEIAERLNRIGKPIIAIHGNHETESAAKKVFKKYKNFTYIDKKTLRMNKFLFIGYGDGGFSHQDKVFDKLAEKVKGHIKPADNIILITHGPPYKTNLDRIYDDHCGSKPIRKFIKDIQPRLALCGHIHECENEQDKIGKTPIFNPGPYGTVFDLEL